MNSNSNIVKKKKTSKQTKTRYTTRSEIFAYILEFLKSLPETVDKIERMTEMSSTDIVINVPREENIVMVRFSEEIAHVFNSMRKIKNGL
jgi:hypothetical protein